MARKEWLVFVCFILFTLVSSQARGQQNGEIKGTVVESASNAPLEDATVRLLSDIDNSMIAVIATDEDGAFVIKNIPAGSYLLMVTYIGFEPEYQPVEIKARNGNIDVGSIEMKEGIVYLDEVVVKADYTESKYWTDRIVFNAENRNVWEKLLLELPIRIKPEVAENSDETDTPTIKRRWFN
jgi:hypothetical protein